jgi:hypothetical protein
LTLANAAVKGLQDEKHPFVIQAATGAGKSPHNRGYMPPHQQANFDFATLQRNTGTELPKAIEL